MTKRTFPPADVKLLYGLAAARCAFPKCQKVCASPATDKDPAVILGRIAHIYAHSDSGPRANSVMTLKERDSYANWILLCADHHDVVDKQANSHTADDLLSWKRTHESWVEKQLAAAVPSISFLELEMVTQSILTSAVDPTDNFTIITPKQKITKNSLSAKIESRIMLGLVKAKEVEGFVRDVSKRMANFPERLSNGFVTEYKRLRDSGVSGDALFESLHEFSCGGQTDFDKQSAGLAVLVYLFEKCEVFEK